MHVRNIKYKAVQELRYWRSHVTWSWSDRQYQHFSPPFSNKVDNGQIQVVF